MNNTPLPKSYLAKDLKVGICEAFEAIIDDQLVKDFANFSGDYNPLHTDQAFSKALNYENIVAHGAIQQSLISRLAGMYLPGKYCIIKSLHTNYLRPLIPKETVRVSGSLIKWNENNFDGEIEVKITSIKNSTLYSISNVKIGLTQTSSSKNKPIIGIQSNLDNKNSSGQTDRSILLIGGNGGLGGEISKYFSSDLGYKIHTCSRSENCDLQYDPTKTEDFDKLKNYIKEFNIYGIVLLSSLPPIKNSIENFDLEHLKKNLDVHLNPLKAIAQLVRLSEIESLKRVILIGSSGSRDLFFESGFESYSYAKQLAKEYLFDISGALAKYKTTFNCISPSELHVGMNSHLSERYIQLLDAKQPTGKMTSCYEVYQTLKIILDDKSEMIRGQDFILAGARTK